MRLQGIRPEGIQRLAQADYSRIAALADFLGVDPEEIEDSGYKEGLYQTPEGDYLVLTDEEADNEVANYLDDSAWTFNADFIVQYTNLPREASEMIKAFQEAKYEDSNPTIKALITDWNEFVSDAISTEGRGHFLATYDSEENYNANFYIYRTD